MKIQSHQGEAVTCLRAEWAGSNVGPNHPCGWWVVTGDRRGLIVISSGEFSPIPKGGDVTAEDESSKSAIERRGGISNGISRHHQMSVKSVPIRTLSSDGEITCLAFTRSRSRNKSRINEKNSVEGGRGRVTSSVSEGGTLSEREVEREGEMVAVGTATGRIAIFDLHSGQVSNRPILTEYSCTRILKL
jgi:hypothetical protein